MYVPVMGLMSAKENSTCQNLIFEAIDRAKGSKSVGPLHFYYLAPCLALPFCCAHKIFGKVHATSSLACQL